MPNYRLYRLDGAGKISSAEWIEAESDGDAQREARALTDQSSFELWAKNRLVERFQLGTPGRPPAPEGA